MASRRRRAHRRHRFERRLLWGCVVAAVVLVTMLATGIGVREPDDAAAPTATAPPRASTSTSRPPTTTTPSVTRASVAPPTTVPADPACSAVASITQLRPIHSRLSASVRAASASPDDGALAAQAIARIDEYRAQHLSRFVNSLGQLARAEPGLATQADRVARFFEAGLLTLDRATDGASLAAASRELVESPEFDRTIDALIDIGGYGADRCGIVG